MDCGGSDFGFRDASRILRVSKCFERERSKKRECDKKHSRNGILKLLKNEDGWSVITLLPAVLILTFILFAGVEYWSIMTIYQQAEHVKYYALSSMEVNGGLTPEMEEEIRDKLAKISKEGTVKIKGTLLSSMDPVFKPDKVQLEIEFTPKIDNFLARTLLGGAPGKPIKIKVGGEAISHRPHA